MPSSVNLSFSDLVAFAASALREALRGDLGARVRGERYDRLVERVHDTACDDLGDCVVTLHAAAERVPDRDDTDVRVGGEDVVHAPEGGVSHPRAESGHRLVRPDVVRAVRAGLVDQDRPGLKHDLESRQNRTAGCGRLQPEIETQVDEGEVHREVAGGLVGGGVTLRPDPQTVLDQLVVSGRARLGQVPAVERGEVLRGRRGALLQLRRAGTVHGLRPGLLVDDLALVDLDPGGAGRLLGPVGVGVVVRLAASGEVVDRLGRRGLLVDHPARVDDLPSVAGVADVDERRSLELSLSSPARLGRVPLRAAVGRLVAVLPGLDAGSVEVGVHGQVVGAGRHSSRGRDGVRPRRVQAGRNRAPDTGRPGRGRPIPGRTVDLLRSGVVAVPAELPVLDLLLSRDRLGVLVLLVAHLVVVDDIHHALVAAAAPALAGVDARLAALPVVLVVAVDLHPRHLEAPGQPEGGPGDERLPDVELLRVVVRPVQRLEVEVLVPLGRLEVDVTSILEGVPVRQRDAGRVHRVGRRIVRAAGIRRRAGSDQRAHQQGDRSCESGDQLDRSTDATEPQRGHSVHLSIEYS